MATQTKSSGTLADDSGTGTLVWSNPGNAVSSNNSYATAASGDAGDNYSHYLKATNFGFTIPSGATINGITVNIERKATTLNASYYIRDNIVRLVKGGTISGTDNADLATNWPTGDTVKVYGGAADLWGLAFGVADINGSTFGVVLSCRIHNAALIAARTASVDYIEIVVDYTAATGGVFSQRWQVV